MKTFNFFKILAVVFASSLFISCEKAEPELKETASSNVPNYILLIDGEGGEDNIQFNLYTDDFSFLPEITINGETFAPSLDYQGNEIIDGTFKNNNNGNITFSISKGAEGILSGEIKLPTLTGIKVNSKNIPYVNFNHSLGTIYDASKLYDIEILASDYSSIYRYIDWSTTNAYHIIGSAFMNGNKEQVKIDSNFVHLSFFWDLYSGSALKSGDTPNFSSDEANCYVNVNSGSYNILIKESAQKSSSIEVSSVAGNNQELKSKALLFLKSLRTNQ